MESLCLGQGLKHIQKGSGNLTVSWPLMNLFSPFSKLWGGAWVLSLPQFLAPAVLQRLYRTEDKWVYEANLCHGALCSDSPPMTSSFLLPSASLPAAAPPPPLPLPPQPIPSPPHQIASIPSLLTRPPPQGLFPNTFSLLLPASAAVCLQDTTHVIFQ